MRIKNALNEAERAVKSPPSQLPGERRGLKLEGALRSKTPFEVSSSLEGCPPAIPFRRGRDKTDGLPEFSELDVGACFSVCLPGRIGYGGDSENAVQDALSPFQLLPVSHVPGITFKAFEFKAE